MSSTKRILAQRLLLVAALVAGAPAQASQLFTNYTTADGLLSDSIYDIYAANGKVYLAHPGGMTAMTQSNSTFAAVEQMQGAITLSVTGSGNYVYASKWYGGVISVSSDNGANWPEISTAYADPLIAYGDGFVLDIASSGSKVAVATQSLGLGLSNDNGATWYTRYIPGATHPTDGYQAELDAVHLRAGTIYVGIRGALNQQWVDGVLGISNDDGITWSTHNLGSYINEITTDNGYLYVATDAGLRVSADNGQSWNLYTTANGLGSNLVNSIVASAGYLFAGTSGGLGVSSDNGATWTNYSSSDGLPIDYAGSIFVSGDTLYAATSGLSVASISSLTAIPEPSTYGLALAGIALAGAALRRRRKAGA